MKKILPVLALTIALSGCFSETVVDTSSVEALNASIKELSEEMPMDERLRFEAAIQTLIEANRGDNRSLAEIAAALTPQIGGKTPAEVIAVADAWTIAEEKRVAEMKRQKMLDELDGKIREYSAEIPRLETVIAEQAANVKKVLGEFSVSGERYFWRGPTGGEYPVIEVDVTNSHSQPIETVVIRGVLRAAGKAEPLVDGQLRYEFSARLTPGETERAHFEPDHYGAWAKAGLQDRKDLELSTEVVNMTFQDGTELIKSYVFRGDDPVLQLETLKRRLKDAKAELDALMAGAEAKSS